MHSIPQVWFVVTAVLVVVCVFVVALLAETAWLFLQNKKQLAQLGQTLDARYVRAAGDLDGEPAARSELR